MASRALPATNVALRGFDELRVFVAVLKTGAVADHFMASNEHGLGAVCKQSVGPIGIWVETDTNERQML